MPQVLPPPPVPASLDLRDFPYMPLDVVRLRDSELAVMTKGDEFRCAVLLWCAAWHQVPASSLPDDDRLLADLAGFGRVVKEWRKVRAGALRGFEKCSDGRLYHGVVASKALDAWRVRMESRHTREVQRLKKWSQRHGEPVDIPTFDAWLWAECPEDAHYLSKGQPPECPRDKPPMSPDSPPDVPSKSATTEGKGREGKELQQRFPGDDSTPATPPPAAALPQPHDPERLTAILAECARAKVEDASPESEHLARLMGLGTNAQLTRALADCRLPFRKPFPQKLTLGYVETVLADIVAEERKARAAADAKVERTQAQVADQRTWQTSPMPDSLKPRKAAAA